MLHATARCLRVHSHSSVRIGNARLVAQTGSLLEEIGRDLFEGFERLDDAVHVVHTLHVMLRGQVVDRVQGARQM